jgi:AAA ATPase-like protein
MRVTLLSMRLLERESSLASLAGYAQEARRGDGRLVLVAGEAGVGKSALLERFQCDLLDVAALIGTRSDLRLVESVTSGRPAALDEVLASGSLAEDRGVAEVPS